VSGELRFDGDVVIVTGGARGIGRSQAIELARRGARVVVNDLGGSPRGGGSDPTMARAVVDEIVSAGGEAVASGASVSSDDGPAQIVAAAMDTWGRIDGLIHNAAIVLDDHFEDVTDDDLDNVLAVNLRGTFRTVFFAPVVTNVVAVAMIWQYAFNANGTVNKVLGAVGFAGPNWLDDTHLAMPVVILLGVWRNFGIAMVLFLAGLQAIPQDVYEAASLDGAGRWRQLRHITLPLLMPTTLMVSVLLTVFYLQVFDEPYLLTNGGPLGSTESVALYTYHQFGVGEFGMSSAASFVMLLLVTLVSIVQFRMLRPRA